MLIGPLTLEVKVHVANEYAGTVGAVNCTLPPGQVPTLEDLHRSIGQAIAALPDGYRLMEPDEFFNGVIVREKTGRYGNFAVPGEFRYDAVAVAAAGAAAYVPEPDGEPEADDEGCGDDDDEDDV